MFSKILKIACSLACLLNGCQNEEGAIINGARPPQPRIRNYGGPVWGPNNLIIFQHTARIDSSRLWLMRPDGTEKQPFLPLWRVRDFDEPDWSPDGRWLALHRYDDAQIYKIRATGDSLAQLTSGPLRKFFPTWSPDGQWIAFSVNIGDYSDWGIWKVNVNTKAMYQIKQVAGRNPDWSPKGDHIAFVGFLEEHISRLAVLDLNDGRVRILFRPEKFDYNYGVDNPQFSPDGSKIAFQTNQTETRDPEIWVINADGSNPQKFTGGWDSHFVIYNGGGLEPSWSPDGQKIIYARYSKEIRETPGNGKLWMMDATGRNKQQLTF
jgi:Tol biopolymer transport system component